MSWIQSLPLPALIYHLMLSSEAHPTSCSQLQQLLCPVQTAATSLSLPLAGAAIPLILLPLPQGGELLGVGAESVSGCGMFRKVNFSRGRSNAQQVLLEETSPQLSQQLVTSSCSSTCLSSSLGKGVKVGGKGGHYYFHHLR